MVRASGLRTVEELSKEALGVHRRAKLTVLGRRLLIQRIIAEGWPVARAAEAQGVSVATAYKWLGRWRTEGTAGLADRSCRPHRSPRRLPAAREQAILAWRQAHRVGPHRIGWALGEAPSTVHAVLARHRLPRLWELDRPTGQIVRYQRQRPGELLHVDIKPQGRIPDGGGHRLLGRGQGGANHDRRHGLGYDYLHVAVDDRTRLAYVEAHDRQDGPAAADFTARALAWFAQLGVQVERVLTDNGWCYRSQAFQQVLAQTGTRHRRTRPYRPQTNGKAERFNLTLATEWSYAQLYTSNQDRLAALAGWLHHYNSHRPHTALGGQSPMQTLNNLNNLPGNHT
jgi:transposase InsO family protein